MLSILQPSLVFTREGETIWAIYAIGVHEAQTWWKACFTDTQVLVEDVKAGRYAIPYADMCGIRLPEPSKAPFVAEFGNSCFCYDRGFIIGHNGWEYEVRGSVREDGKRDIYLWFAIVGGARYDQERYERHG